MALLQDIQSGLKRAGAPVCIAIIIVSSINLVLSFVLQPANWNLYLAFLPTYAASRPWTFLTYPFAIDLNGLIGVIFSCWWLYGIGGSVERELGTTRFSVFWAAMSVIPAMVMWAAMPLTHQINPLVFMFLPLAGVTIAWATRNPTAIVNFMLIIPIQARWLGMLTAALVLFGYGIGHPMLGLFACLHLILAFLYAGNYLPFLPYGRTRYVRKQEHWKKSERDDSYLSNVKQRQMEREERDRLRKLFEGSIKDDPEDKS